VEKMQQIGALIRTQSNAHMTANPLYVVYEKERIYTDHNPDEYEWFHQDSQSVADKQEHERLEAAFDDMEETPEGWLRLGYIERDRFVTACFTRKATEHYLAINGRNLKKPHVYVHSLFRNEEMQAIRDFLMGLPEPGATP